MISIYGFVLKVSGLSCPQIQLLALVLSARICVYPPLRFRDLEIRLAIHRSDTVSVVVGCSYAPIAVDCGGIIRLSNALTRVEERLCRLIDSCGSSGNGGVTVTKESNISGSSIEQKLLVPEHSSWIVTMWHFGLDSITEYTGDKFSATWEVGLNALIRAYSKDMKEQGRTTIRLERQEYPNKKFADAIEEKLRDESFGVLGKESKSTKKGKGGIK
jgi:hypothetical protein